MKAPFCIHDTRPGEPEQPEEIPVTHHKVESWLLPSSTNNRRWLDYKLETIGVSLMKKNDFRDDSEIGFVILRETFLDFIKL